MPQEPEERIAALEWNLRLVTWFARSASEEAVTR